MSKTKQSKIDYELDFLEEKLQDIKSYIDSNPYSTMSDRVIHGSKGVKVVATIEQQQKAIRESLKEYASLLEAVDKLRQREEEKKINAKGGTKISFLAEKSLKSE